MEKLNLRISHAATLHQLFNFLHLGSKSYQNYIKIISKSYQNYIKIISKLYQNYIKMDQVEADVDPVSSHLLPSTFPCNLCSYLHKAKQPTQVHLLSITKANWTTLPSVDTLIRLNLKSKSKTNLTMRQAGLSSAGDPDVDRPTQLICVSETRVSTGNLPLPRKFPSLLFFVVACFKLECTAGLIFGKRVARSCSLPTAFLLSLQQVPPCVNM